MNQLSFPIMSKFKIKIHTRAETIIEIKTRLRDFRKKDNLPSLKDKEIIKNNQKTIEKNICPLKITIKVLKCLN